MKAAESQSFVIMCNMPPKEEDNVSLFERGSFHMCCLSARGPWNTFGGGRVCVGGGGVLGLWLDGVAEWKSGQIRLIWTVWEPRADSHTGLEC